MLYKIHLKQKESTPAIAFIEGEYIICNDVNLPEEIDASNSFNPHNVRGWVMGNEVGPICMIFASCAQDAFDEAVDAGVLDSLLNEEQDHSDGTLTPLGNASELFDLSYAWIGEVEFDAARDIHLIIALVRASASGSDKLK